MYMSNEYREGDRQIKKYAEKMSWYDNARDYTWVKVEWRNKLRGMWKGKRPLQRGVKDMRFTTVIQVPNTKNGMLIKDLARLEPSLAQATGYNVKIIEKSGV